MITCVDTDQMEEIARDITDATNELEGEIEALYKRLADVPTGSKEWVGNQAEAYFARTETDKSECSQLVNQLRDFSQELSNEASTVGSTVRENNTAD